ncbi:MAG: protein kinase [Planctomycetales bacterium]|nr:protein kinase [Planctomycetales bacterium]
MGERLVDGAGDCDEVHLLFEAALKLHPDLRIEFLASLKRTHSESLAAEVHSLLEAHARADQRSFLRSNESDEWQLARFVDSCLDKDREHLANVCQQFAEALRAGRNATAESFLPDVRDPTFAHYLERLLLTELRERAALHWPIELTELRARFPDHETLVQQIWSDHAASQERRANEESTWNRLSHSRDVQTSQQVGRESGDANRSLPRDVSDDTRLDIDLSFFAESRYQLQRPLGVGGQKRVYLARDKVLQRPVVVSMLLESVASRKSGESLRTEATLLAQLGDHPNIVTIYDLGESDQFSFIVSQYVASGSLRELLARNAGHPLSMTRAIEIAAETCAALAHAHERGILHLDVKPGNIWLMDGGQVKLGDFGLARTWSMEQFAPGGEAFERGDESLSHHKAAGTPAYMSPEQVLNRRIGPASDLYAVGIVLYELTTGQRPFVGGDMLTLVSQHLNMEPVAPSRLNVQISADLDLLIMQLLEKDPSRRCSDAREVARRLSAMLVPTAGTWQSKATRHASVGLARGVFVGRHEEMAELRRQLEESRLGATGSVFILGEPGSGKTRLSEELTTYAQLRSVTVFRGRSFQAAGAPPFWPWIQVLRQLAGAEHAVELLHELPSGAANYIALMDDELRASLGDVPLPPNVDLQQQRFQLFEAISQWIARLAQREPIMLLLDDLQWADEASLRLFAHLHQSVSRAKLMVVSTCRADAIRPGMPIAALLGEISREANVTQIHLSGMPVHEVRDFIALTIGTSVPDELGEKVWKRTAGNPFFVSEVIRLLAGDRTLDHIDELATQDLLIPQQVQQVIHRRLELLSDSCRRVLTTAAIIGRRFELQLLRRLLDRDMGEVLDALDEAVATGILEPATTSYLFVHDLIHETILASLSTALRIELHLRAAEAIETIYQGALRPKFGELAQHYFQALPVSEVAKVIESACAAAEYASEQLAYEESIKYLAMAIRVVENQVPTDWQRLARLWVDQGEAQRRAGLLDNSLTSFRKAINCAKNLSHGGELAEAVIGLEASLWQTNEIALETLALAVQANAMLDDSQNALRATLKMAQARAIYHTGGRDRAVQLANESLQIARRSGDTHTLARVLGCVNHVFQGPRNLQTRLDFVQELIDISQTPQFREHRVEALIWQAIDQTTSGNIPAVKQTVAQLRSAFERVRHPFYEYTVELFRVMLLILEARLVEARDVAVTACQLGKRIRGTAVEGSFGVQMFCIARELGHLGALVPQLEKFGASDVDSLWLPGLVIAYASTDQRETASAHFEILAEGDFRSLAADGNYPLTLAYLAEVAYFLDDQERAALLYDRLIDYQDQTIIGGGATVCLGSASRFLGLLAHCTRQFDLSELHFDKALRINREMGAVAWLAHAKLDYAEMLLQRHLGTDGQRAYDLVDRARSIAQKWQLPEVRTRIRRVASLFNS